MRRSTLCGLVRENPQFLVFLFHASLLGVFCPNAGTVRSPLCAGLWNVVLTPFALLVFSLTSCSKTVKKSS